MLSILFMEYSIKKFIKHTKSIQQEDFSEINEAKSRHIANVSL